MYSIGNIVFGLNLAPPTQRGQADFFDGFRLELNQLQEANISVADITGQKYSRLVTSQYSGSGEPPLYFGIDVGQIDECNDILASDLIPQLTATDAHREQYLALLGRLENYASAQLVQAMRNIEPYVFITWSTS